MLTLRRSSAYLRVPTSRVVCPLGSEFLFSGSHLSRSVPPLRSHLTRQQFRPYLFVPVSWDEAKERLERWLEQTQSRIVKVSLLKRNRRNTSLPEADFQRRRRKSKNISKKRRLYSEAQLPSPLSLPVPSPGSPLASIKSVQIKKAYHKWKTLRETDYRLWKDIQREQYRGWKSRRQAQYQGWKFRRQAQFRGWKSRRQAQYQQWNAKRNDDWIKRRQVILEEYSKSEWFDALGRPLTARDSTGRFVNPWQSQSTNGVISAGILLRWKWQRFLNSFFKYIYDPMLPSEKKSSSSPLLGQPVPPLPVPQESSLHLTWIGRSTCLFQVEKNFTILTDPIFSNRASPYKNIIGVARDVPPAWSIEDLIKHHTKNAIADCTEEAGREQNNDIRKLDICCVTHDHYDHMDRESVKELKHHIQLWVVPLGIGDWLVEKCSIDRERIVELRWWEQILIGKKKGRVVVLGSDESEDNPFIREDCNNDEVLTITCCPSSHWAGRTVWDRNKRLWCSFAFSTMSFRFFMCGDTGYPSFPLFRQIGDALGPFDLSCIPIGAYEPEELNKDAHCDPYEAVKMHEDLHSKHSVGIHWGSFQLGEEAMSAPPTELENAIRADYEQKRANKNFSCSPVNFTVLGHGETLIKQSTNAAQVTASPSMSG